MNERLKQIRIDAKKTQSKFAESLGVSLSNIKSYELGLRNPSDAVINLICRTFNVNETWLLTGEGSMHSPETREQKIAAITAAIYKDDDGFRTALIEALVNLDSDQIAALKNIADKMYENYKNNED